MMYVNHWAVLVSAIASMVIGSIWYGPLFGKLFMREMGMDKWSKEKQEEAKKSMGLNYLLQFIASLVMFYVFAGIMSESERVTMSGGLMSAIVVWIGFVVPVKLADAIWGGNRTLFWLNIGNLLITLLASGAIIGAWK